MKKFKNGAWNAPNSTNSIANTATVEPGASAVSVLGGGRANEPSAFGSLVHDATTATVTTA